MPLSSGDKLGPYEILSRIGAGGMGEVYKARDTRLDRIVAIKTSKSNFDERFEREARAIATLNHPHICTLHDIGPNYLVMEYIEGTPLKGPLPLDQALKYAAQICDALDAAHRKGITHRDLKPANILVTKTAGIKLLDFGLAKIEKPSGPSDATRTMALTSEGQILGTLYYMSPEQLQGQEAGPSSDIFSFGLVLYEMLTGKRAFDGNSQASVIAAILERPAPSISSVAPAALDRVLKRCLEKDPENRWQGARDLKAELEWIATGGPEKPQVAKSRPSWVMSAIAAGAVIVALALGFVHFRETPPATLALRLPVALPEFNGLNSLALSPDGRTLVIAASPLTGQGQLYLRSLDSVEFRPLSNTGRTPFWSADGRSVAFFSDGKLKIVSARGGPAQTLCDSGLGSGGTWSRDGVILFGNTATGEILRVSASGGGCTPVLTPEGNAKYSFPIFLPDGRHFVYVSSGGEDDSRTGVYIASVDNHAGHRLLADQSSVIFAPPDPGRKLAHLVFLRDTTLMAQPFDLGALQPVGEVFPVVPQASFSNTAPQVAAAVGANGVLVYISNRTTEQQLTWFDRSGKELGRVGPHALNQPLSLSPDGKSVAVMRQDAPNQWVLWLRDLTRDVESRLTAPTQSSESPVWSPDGARIAFSMNQQDLYLKETSGGSEELLVHNTNPKFPADWSPDGRFLLYTEIDPKTQGDIWILSDPLNKSGGRKQVPFLRTRFDEGQAQFSPDGHWVAYSSNESGTSQVYIRPFSSPASGSNAQLQVSTGARADQPRWSRDGKELFYLEGAAPRRRLMSILINQGMRPVAAGIIPKLLFALRARERVVDLNAFAYSPSPDGQRFLVSAFADENVDATLNVLVNWQALAKKGATTP